MPFKILLRHRNRKAVIKKTFQIFFIAIFFIYPVRGEKVCRRKLLGVTYNYYIFTPCDSSYSFTCRKLRSFIEYDQIKLWERGINILSYRYGTHKHTWAKFSEKIWYLLKKASERHHSSVALYSTFEYAHFRCCSACSSGSRYPGRKTGCQFLHSKKREFI